MQFAWRLTYHKHINTCHAVIYNLHRCGCAYSQSIFSGTWFVSNILPYLVSADLKHILDGPVNIYVSSNLKQNSSLCFQNQFTSESCSLSEFGSWMFIETGATAVCNLLFRNPSRGLSVHSSLPKNRNLSSLSELELVPLTPPRGTLSPLLFFHNTSFLTVCKLHAPPRVYVNWGCKHHHWCPNAILRYSERPPFLSYALPKPALC